MLCHGKKKRVLPHSISRRIKKTQILIRGGSDEENPSVGDGFSDAGYIHWRVLDSLGRGQGWKRWRKRKRWGI
jgi:hypothetical protein